MEHIGLGGESWSWNQCTFGLSGSKSKCPSSFWKPQVLSFIPFSVALVKLNASCTTVALHLGKLFSLLQP